MERELEFAYEITGHTMALIAGFREGDGRPFTRVLEVDGELDVDEQAYQMMDDNCRDNGSNYKGREEGTRKLTHFQKRLPIVVSEVLDLYAFPLRSPKHDECIWIFHDHFDDVWENGKGKSVILFKNGMTIPVAVSRDIVDNSYKRASHLRYCFSQRIAEKRVSYQTKKGYFSV